MSLGIVIKAPEGLVLAAESRVTLESAAADGRPLSVTYDHAVKLLSFSEPNSWVGALTYGQALLGPRTPASFVPEFEAALPKKRLGVEEFSRRLSAFLLGQWRASMPGDYAGPDMTFVVAGFDEGDPYGRVSLFDIPRRPEPVEQNPGATVFGMTWGGQHEIVHRIVKGFDPAALPIIARELGIDPERTASLGDVLTAELALQLPLDAMPLQDCVDLALFFVRTTIDAQRLSLGIRGCGGPIDVATLTRRDGLRFVQRKSLEGEVGDAGRAR